MGEKRLAKTDSTKVRTIATSDYRNQVIAIESYCKILQGGSGVTSAVGGTVHSWDYMTVYHSVCKSAFVGGLGLLWGEFLPAIV